MKRTSRYWASLPVFILAGSLGYALSTLPGPDVTLPMLIEKHLPDSGVSNPVTAVLLNFRGYDTLLEMAVLMTALIIVRAFSENTLGAYGSSDWFLTRFSALLLPVLLLVSFYLLWAGAHAPGGAFQAGSVLGASGVILLLAGPHSPKHVPEFLSRVLFVIGTTGFVLAALLGMIYGGNMLQYPPQYAGTWIFGIEAAASLSIGITLSALFLALLPRKEPGS